MSEEEIVVPQMVGFEVLTKIVIGYLKVGADQEEKRYSEVGTVANVSENNVSLNAKFLKSIGILEGSRGRFKLTSKGAQYAQSLDWGRLNEANKLLRELLKDRLITQRSLGYVDINKPVEREALVGQIAVIAGVRRESRFETGIRGFVDMLVTSGLLEEDADEKLVIGKPLKPVLGSEPRGEGGVKIGLEAPQLSKKEAFPERTVFPISLSFNIDNETDVENLKKLLRVIKEEFSED